MGNTYAFLVECPRVFSGKTIVLAIGLREALDWVDEYKKRIWGKDCSAEVTSIVCVGEVINS